MAFRRDCRFGEDGTRCLRPSCYNCEEVVEEKSNPPGSTIDISDTKELVDIIHQANDLAFDAQDKIS